MSIIAPLGNQVSTAIKYIKAKPHTIYCKEKKTNGTDIRLPFFSPSLNLNLPSWILVVARNNFFIISLERSATIYSFFYVHSLSYFT